MSEMEEGLLREIYGKILKIEKEIDEIKIVLIPKYILLRMRKK